MSDTISSILSKTNIHVAVVKIYHHPNTIDSKTPVITTSISENTADTLVVLDSTRRPSAS